MRDIVERLRDSNTTRRIGESYADVHDRRQADRNEAADTITSLTARVAELEGALKAWDEAVMADITMEGPVFITVSRRLGRKAWELTRAALTKGERTPSFGDFVEGCDYLPVPSTKGGSRD